MSKTNTIAFIDADTTLYQVTAACTRDVLFGDVVVRQLHLDEAKAQFISEIGALVLDCEASDFILCLTDRGSNWRTEVLPSYKFSREGKLRPLGHDHLLDWVFEEYPCRRHKSLEGDDVLGLLSTGPLYSDYRNIIVSIDKDMKTIPGWLYNPMKQTMVDISLEEADHFHLTQTLTGDSTDGYKGCPGVGPVGAEKVLGMVRPAGRPWVAVVEAYEKANLTEADALAQARVAHILRHGEYDFGTHEVKLWEPS